MRLEPGLLHYFIDEVFRDLQKQWMFAETEEFLKKGIAILQALPAAHTTDAGVTLSRAYLHATPGQLFSKRILNGAMLQYGEVIRISPKEPAFHEKLADIYFISNNDEAAVTEYRPALVQDPENAGFHKRLGDALIKTWQVIDAFNEYRESVRFKPEDEYYRTGYSHFRTLFIASGQNSTKEREYSRHSSLQRPLRAS